MSSNLSIKVLSNRGFDYSSLDAETMSFVQQQTGEIRSLMKRTAQDVIEIGQKLIEVKQRLEHGQYRKWIEAEFNWGKSTANSFENVAKQFTNVQNLDVFAPSALYALAAPSTPKEAREEAIALAQTGKKISYTVSQEIKQKHKSKLAKPESESIEQSLLSKKSRLTRAEIEEKANNFSLISSAVVNPTAPALQQEQSKVVDLYSSTSRKLSIATAKTTENVRFSDDSKSPQSECWWRLGNHLLYCGEPHSQQFQEQLPEKIALAVAFPATHNWHWGNLSSKINSSLILHSKYQDIDLKLLRELLKNALELYTEGQETVFWAFVPDPALLLLTENLDCQCFLAESDIERCEAVIQAWRQIGGKVEKLLVDNSSEKAVG